MFVDSFILGYRYDYYKNERDQQKSSLSRSVRFCRFFHSHLFVFTLLIWAKGIKRASTIVLTIISTNHIFLKLELHPVCSDRKANAEIPKRRTNMAYKLKATRYGGFERKILLQNENGPCPLLAAANALLLRGVVSLPSTCVRAGAASIDDVVNMLAEYALGHNQSHHHQIDEMLTLFPSLQFGMDVNPKFTGGPTGVEYTQNVTAFELLDVELVHGWLLDSDDKETVKLIGNKTYNELVEEIIKGNDASSEMEQICKSIQELDDKLKEMEEWIDVAAEREVSSIEADCSDTEPVKSRVDNKEQEASLVLPSSNPATDMDSTKLAASMPESVTDDKWKARGEIEVLKKKYEALSQHATNGALLNGFLETTGHQLTEYGLEQLNNYLGDDCICVFFRNNHFSTLTKKDGKMFTLVTDLGYANVPEVVWEELDAIDGNTEFFNCMFVKPAPRNDQLVQAPGISPEQMLAQRGQSEADFQFALELSKRDGGGSKTRAQLDDDEGTLVAAATEASIRAYHGLDSEPSIISAPSAGTFVQIPGLNDSSISAVSSSLGFQETSTIQEDQDAMIAQQLQAQMEFDYCDEASAVLARQLHAEEQHMAAAKRAGQNNRRNTRNQPSATTAKGSSCNIS